MQQLGGYAPYLFLYDLLRQGNTEHWHSYHCFQVIHVS